MQTLQVERQTDQNPFTGGRGQTAQRELAKAQDFFDDPNHWLNRAFPQAVNGLADVGPQLVSHLLFQTRIRQWWLRLFVKETAPTLSMRFTSRRDVRFNAPRFQGLDIRR